MFDFAQTNMLVNLAIFAVAAVIVWFAGARITGYATTISSKTGMGQATIGLVLLGGVTSLPEIGATVTSAATGAAELAVNNLFGSTAVQVAILAIVDQLIGRKALTSAIPDPRVMLQGGLNILLLAIAAARMVVGDTSVPGVGIWAWMCGAGYALSVYVLSQSRGRKPWIGAERGKVDNRLDKQQAEAEEEASKELADRSLPNLIAWTAGLGFVILVSGYLLSRTGDALSEQSGLGGSFVGFVLLAFATCLPEFSTSVTAAPAGLYTLAVSDILGTNLIHMGLIFVIDLVGTGNPILNQAGAFSVFGALLGALTALFVIGMAERGDKTILRMGMDSAAVLVCYFAGLIVLFFLR